MEEVDLNDQSTMSLAHSEIDLSAEDDADEGPDPRIQVELEKLNTSTDTINKLEVDLDEARMLFRQLLSDSTQRIDVLAKRLGKCVEQSRPYYEARIRAKQALGETQTAAVRYERAMSQHAAAREMVFLAEEGLMQKGCTFDHTWQEMLNHATSKVNDAEREKIESAAEHRQTSALYHEAETRVKTLQKELKRAIAKSSLNARRSLLQLNNLARMHQLQLLPYFELKAAINQQLEAQKQRVRQLEESVTLAKMTYAQALTNLETISDEIHRVIGLGSQALSSAQYLTVEDRDSTISDTESLASIEMLSDEAIAGLMLDEELAEASNAMGTPLNTPICDIPLPATSGVCPWPSLVQNYVNSSEEPQEASATSENILPDTEGISQEDLCSKMSESLTGLQLDDSFGPMTRQLKPPRSLPLSRDSSSEHSSPEDLTPGYVPLKNVCTPFTPEDCIPPNSTSSSSGPMRRSSSSSDEETRGEPHRSSWVLENVPQIRDDDDATAKP